MVLKTNTRNSLVDDVYDVLISVSCAAAFKLVLLVYGLVMVDVLGGTARECLVSGERTLRRPETSPKELAPGCVRCIYFNTFMFYM